MVDPLNKSEISAFNPEQELRSEEILTDAERHKLLVEWNNTTREYPQGKCIHQLFEEQVERSPDAVAVVFGGEQLTYCELNAKANQLAHYLRHLGVESEVLVGICVERSFEMIVGILGILKAGGAYVPIDPNYPSERLAFMVEDSSVPVLLTQQKLVDKLPPNSACVVCLDFDQIEILSQSEENPTSKVTPDNLAYVIYTSGSTGKPKGVAMSHRPLCNLIEWQLQNSTLPDGAKTLQFSPISFDVSFQEIFATWCAGGTLVSISEEVRRDPVQLLHFLKLEAIARLFLPFVALQQLAEVADGQEVVPTSLREVITAGEQLQITRQIANWFTKLNNCTLHNHYGPSESHVVTAFTLTGLPSSWPALPPIGRPINNTQIYLLNDQLQPVPSGVSGELYIGGIALARGYLNRPNLTEERFIPNPFSDKPGERLYKTGDIASYLPDGNIKYQGRSDTQVKIRGFRIELGEIEATLWQHPAVREVSVVAREDVPGDNKRLVAYVVQNSQDRSWQEQVADLQAEQVSQWQTVYEEIYSETSAADPTFNISGWNSSYTGKPIPAEEMRQWLGHTTHLLLSLQPRRVLDIGCGTGMLLFRIAPHCTQYFATDFSQAVVDYLQQQLHKVEPPLPQVALDCRTADDFRLIEAQSFDGVVLNGVLQLFPSIDYLLRVLEGAVNVVSDGGFIFIGDVVSLPLLAAYHTSIELNRASNSVSRSQLKERIQQGTAQEEKLVIDPAFFIALKQHLPQIGQVKIHLKRGQYHNEITRFHYDAILNIGEQVSATKNIQWLDWQPDWTKASIHELLQTTEAEILGLRHVPNARLETEIKTIRWLASNDGPETVGEWRSVLQQSIIGIDPEELWSLSEQLSFDIEINWLEASADGSYDVIFRRHSRQELTELPAKVVTEKDTVPLKPWSHYANQPLQGKVSQKLIPLLRSFLQEKLPDYMVPSSFVLLDALPLTPTGKVDRRALPAPGTTRPELKEDFVAPRTPNEEILAGIWAEVLGIEPVGIHDNFLELGGHSLLATQIISRLRDALKVELSLNSLFAFPTLAELATHIQAGDWENKALAPSIQPISRNQKLPLSWNQQQLWFIAQLEPDSPVYNEPYAIAFRGAINVASLEKALNEIVRRHEILRTRFITVDGEPIQKIEPPSGLNLTVVDLRQLPQEEREAEALRLATWEVKQRFDLTTGPLLRATLMQLGSQEYRLFLTFHHIVIDGVSLYSVFVPELAALYEAFSCGQPSPLRELSVQYANFAVWQRQWFTGEILENLLDYWKQQLADLPVLQLPLDRPYSAKQTFRGASKYWTLSKSLIEALKNLSRQKGVTLYMTLLAAFKTLLYRYSGQEDIVVGTVSAGRNRLETEGVIGFFLNTLVLRTDLSGCPSFRELLLRVREVTLGAYAHESLPFGKLVELLQPERNINQNPLFQVALNLRPSMPDLNLDWALSEVEIQTDTAKFDLTLELEERAEEIIGRFEYRTDLFEANTISRMIGHFQTLLEGIVADPKARVSLLPLLTPAEQQELLVEWNNTTTEYPQNKCIHQLFEAQVERTPDAVAVVFEREQLTYRELNARANQLAHYLRSLGVGPEVLVGICVERSLEMVIGLLGILKAGGGYVPLDPAYPGERITYVLKDAGALVWVTQKSLLENLPESGARLVCLDANGNEIAQHRKDNPHSLVKPDNLAYVIYTSGSTGQPKGVQIPHNPVVNFLASMLVSPGLKASDILLAVTTLSFDIAALEIFLPLTVGASSVMVSREVASDGGQLSAAIARTGATIMQATPATWRMLLESGWIGNSNLKILCGGEALPRELANQLLSRCQSLWNMYGPTETTIWSAVSVVQAGDEPVPIGRAIANTKFYICDSYLQPVPVGVRGELHIGGIGLARGYLNRLSLTDEKFIPNPFSNEPGERLYKTGDLARYLPDGNIEYLGRIDNQVKIRGFRIELGEIEAILSQYPGVRETAVIAKDFVAGDKQLVAYVVPQQEGTPTITDLRHFLKQKLPDYMVPGAFVVLEALPLTPNGKVDRRALPAPDLRPELEEFFVAPRTPIEEMLASIWSNILLIDSVGVHDNFFTLGGHSLLATQVISRVRDTILIELPLRSLFEAPTIAEFASRVEIALKNGKSVEALPLLPISRSEPIPLSFAQTRLWFLDQLQPNSAFYNIPLALRLFGLLNIAPLESSINEIIRRHEALRTNFAIVEGQPVQVIATTLSFQLPVVNLLHLSESQREIEAKRLATVEANRPFNLEQEPLLRGTVLQLGETEYLLLLTMHHIISDGWSLGVFVRELTELYKAFCTGKSPSLPELPVQYADFAVWQRQWLTGEILETQLYYWKQQLLEAPALLELPTDRSRPSVQTFRGGYYYAAFSKELSAELTALSKRSGVTLFMTLVAVFVTLLSRYTSSDDIIVGTPVAGRNRREIEGLIGFFVNTLVLRTNLSGNPTFEQLLNRVREVALQAYAHQDLPFEQLVEVLQPTRDLSYTPLFQVMFALDDALVPAMELPELTVSSYPVEIGTAKFDLSLSMENTASGLVAIWEYNADLFDEETLARMAGHFQTLLEEIVTNPKQTISELPLLTQAERHQLLVEWNNTWTEYPQDNKCIHQLFEAQVEQSPDAVAVVFEEEQLTYRELNAKANQLAHYLRSLGVKPEVLVGICVERSFDAIVGILGILKTGSAYVPIDPGYPSERIACMLDDSQLPVLLTQKQLVASLPKHQARVVCLDADWEEISSESKLSPITGVTPENLAYVIYTSGSTGKPKGVPVPHRAVNRLVINTNYINFQPLDIVAFASNFAFDAATFEIWGALLNGAKLVVITKDVVLSPYEFAGQIQEQGITVLFLTTALFNILAREIPSAFKSVQHLLFGGEAVEPKWVKEVLKKGSPQRLLHVYGPTENTTFTSWYLVEGVTEEATTIPIGRPIANTQVYVLDTQLQPVPIGVPGELYIGGDGLARGYFNRSDLTDEKFISNPFSNHPNSRLYKTGDLARYLPDGNIEFLGRIDNQVKIRGFRIELGEIETAISQHPSVKQTVVIAAENNIGHKQLVAYIVPQPQAAPASSDLRNCLKQKLPDYMIPATFITLETFPLTPNGKIDTKALPKPETANQELIITKVLPQTSTQKILATIWAEVLQIQEVGIHDNFFELGGDSILSIQIIARCHQANLQLTPKDLFQHQTIAELAQIVTTSAEITVAQGLVTGIVPLTPIQHWFVEQNLPEPHHFNQSFLFEISPDLKPELLQQVLQKLLLHHDALRLRLIPNSDTWQLINASAEESGIFSIIVLSQIRPTEQIAAIETTANQLQASLNLSEGPILRVALFHLGNNQPNRLLIIIHHLAVDGVSWRILLEDLIAAYHQLNRGETIQLPAKTTCFQDWAVRLTEYAQTQTALAELDYWLTQLNSHIEPLPVDYPASIVENKIVATAVVTVSLSAAQTTALLKEVPSAYNTQINDVLLTALVQSFAQWTGQSYLLIDLEGHGREELFADVDLSRTIGWFTSIFPVLLKLEQAEFPGKSLKSIKEQLRHIPQRGIGYGIIRYLNEDETTRQQLQQLPQAQVSFNYLGQFDQMLSAFPILGLAKESSGSPVSFKGNRSHLLEIDGFVADGKLQLSWAYNTKIHQSATIERLANSFIAALTGIISHCLSPDNFGYTPTDFPDADLTQAELDELVESLTPRTLLESIYPLSPMQEGMLFHTLYAPESGIYFVQSVFTLCGNLQVWAWEQAWRRVVELHPILRTLFVWKNHQHPLQVVCKSVDLPWHIYDWCSLEETEQKERLEALLQTERQPGFELDKVPLMCCTLIRLAEDNYQFVWSHHHLLIDGWCLQIVLKQVWAFYEAMNRGENLYLEAPPPYRNYIAWLRRQDLETAQKFWRSQLAGFTAPTPLVVDKLVGHLSQEKDIYDEREIKLSATVTETLSCFARQHHLTLNTLVQGAWALLLSRYSGESDVVFGATVSGRPPALSGVELMVGLFINTLPVRVQISSETELLSWLHQLQAQQVERELYSYTPLVEIHGVSEVPRNLPLFESIVVFENYPVNSSLLQGHASLEVSNVLAFEKTNYPLTVAAVPGEELSVAISYDTSRFDEATIHRLLGHFQSLLEGIVTNSQGRISDLSLLTEQERHQLLVEWNNTWVEYPQDKCIHQLFEAQVERSPDAIAVVFEGEQLTYKELNQRANRIAHHLQDQGVEPEMLVGVCVERSLEMIIGLLGILKAGGAYVPLDPNYPSERLAFMLEDSSVPVLLTQEKLLEKLPAHSARVICLDSDSKEIASYPKENPLSLVKPENLAYVIYTSGSTGKPKGVLIQHESLVNYTTVAIAEYVISQSDRILQFSSISFDVSAEEIYTSLTSGATLVLRTDSMLDSIEGFLQKCKNWEITVMALPTAYWHELTAFLSQKTVVLPPSLRLIIIGGEKALPERLKTWLECVGQRVRLVNNYGPTEATVGATIYDLSVGDTTLKELPIGRPLGNVQTYILDGNGQPVPIGIPGELHIGGAGLARGYLNCPDLTNERFIRNPFSHSPTSRLYKTGDNARYLPDGNIEFIGRIDNQVKIRGFRIEIGEIEALLAQHPDVREMAVIDREDTPGNKRLVAYVVSNLIPDRIPYHSKCQLELNGNAITIHTQDISTGGVGLVGMPAIEQGKSVRVHMQLPGESEPRWLSGTVVWSRPPQAGIRFHLTPREQAQVEQSGDYQLDTQDLWKTLQRTVTRNLRDYLKQKLPDYMIPSAFVLMKALPLTPNGKIDRRALPVSDSSNFSNETCFVAPHDTLELQLSQIWSEVLGVDSVGVQDNFFTLGGHSLLAVRLMARLEQQFGKNLPLATLFSSPTIEQLAIHLRSSTDSGNWSPLIPIQSNGSVRPFFCVPGVGGNVLYFYELARHLGSDQPFYGLQARGLDGESEPFTQVEDMAACYIEAIQTVQSQGPYVLGGHSFGGLVAFEIAQQLQKQGHEVALVAIMDTVAPIFSKKPIGVNEDEVDFTEFASYMEYMFYPQWELSKETVASLTQEEQLDYLKEKWSELNFLPKDVASKSFRGLLEVYKANTNAYRNYCPEQVLPTRISVFRASGIDPIDAAMEELLELLKDPTLGWSKFCPAKENYVIPGNHMTMMQTPHVQVLAAQLKTSLELAQVD